MTELSLRDRIALTEEEAALLLGIGERTLRRLREQGSVPVMDVDVDRVLYSRVALERWAVERSGYPSAQGGEDGEEASENTVRPGQRLPRPAGAVGRGRPRGGAVAKAPVRLIRGGGRG